MGTLKFAVVSILFVACAADYVMAETQASTPYRAARIFITDSQSWEVDAGGGGTAGGFGTAGSGGARPQTAEIVKTFGERCPQVVVNNKKEASDYVVVLDHEGGKSIFLRKNKVAVFDRRSGDVVISHSTRSLGNSVQDACEAINKNWQEHGAALRAADVKDDPPATNSQARVSVTSNPDGADIEVDGAFMGNAPSTLELAPGDHVIMLKKNGYRVWQRTIRVTGGEVRLNGQLEPAR